MKINRLQLNINQFTCFVACMLLMAVVSICHYHKIFGIEIEKQGDESGKIETLTLTPDGILTINTTEIGKNIIGYGGPTPVEITIEDGRILKVKPLSNRETPEFYGAVLNSDMLDKLKGMTLQEAADAKMDAVSGATYSSNAIIENVKEGINYALDGNHIPATAKDNEQPVDIKFIITIVIILAGAVLPLFIRNKNYRMLQLVLNVVLLGFWGGTFISYSLMVSAMTNGLAKVALIPVALMLVVAFIYPMFGKVNHYCTWICPYGSLQDIVSKCCKKKISLSQKSVKILTLFREVLWFALMWLLWTGLWFDWMGYEPFAAFFFNDASAVVLGIAGFFVILSLVIQRPYCRFACPTGSLFKFSEGRK